MRPIRFNESYYPIPAAALDADPASDMRGLLFRLASAESSLQECELQRRNDLQEMLIELIELSDRVMAAVESADASSDARETAVVNGLVLGRAIRELRPSPVEAITYRHADDETVAVVAKRESGGSLRHCCASSASATAGRMAFCAKPRWGERSGDAKATGSTRLRAGASGGGSMTEHLTVLIAADLPADDAACPRATRIWPGWIQLEKRLLLYNEERRGPFGRSRGGRCSDVRACSMTLGQPIGCSPRSMRLRAI